MISLRRQDLCMAVGESGTLDELWNGLLLNRGSLFEWGVLGVEPLALCIPGKCSTLSYIPSLDHIFKGISKVLLEFRNLFGPG